MGIAPIIPPKPNAKPIVTPATPISVPTPASKSTANQIVPPANSPGVADSSDPNFERWFLPSSSGRIARDFSKCKYYVSARSYWDDLFKDLSSVTNPEQDFVYFLGWEMGTDTPLSRSPDISLGDLLLKIGTTLNVAVRAMLTFLPNDYEQKLVTRAPYQNKPAVDFINNLKNGGAIWDSRTIVGGTHHQKIVVLNNKHGLVAYCGGIDIHPSRENWNDAHCRISGLAAYDLHELFVERWEDYVGIWKLLPGILLRRLINRIDLGPSLTKPPTGILADDTVTVQVVRTYPNGSKNGGVNPIGDQFKGIKVNTREFSTYKFSPKGEHTIYDLVAKSIQATQQFIYIQDQYLFAATPMQVGPSVAQLLSNKLKEQEFKCLVIFISRSESINGENRQTWRRRAAFLQMLRTAAPTKLAVCHYRVSPNTECNYVEPAYVHAKSWVFDDRFAIIGSANCNRRGYTHDSEVSVGIYDPVPNNNRLAFAHEFRISQWLRALNEPSRGISGISPKVTRNDLIDFVKASHYWFSPASNSAIAPYELSATSSNAKNPSPDSSGPFPRISDDWNWDHLLDPDGS